MAEHDLILLFMSKKYAVFCLNKIMAGLVKMVESGQFHSLAVIFNFQE